MKERFFVRNYSACWKFFCESRWFVVFSLGIFALLFLVGFAFPIFFRVEVFELMSEIVKMMEGKNFLEMTWFIFFNNAKASLLAIILGIGFGIFPLVTGVVNGYLLGFVAREAVAVEGVWVLWRLLPHGIFELPAILLSIGIGMRLGVTMTRCRGDKKNELKHNFVEAMRFFVFVIFPLLLVAGIIEGVLIAISIG